MRRSRRRRGPSSTSPPPTADDEKAQTLFLLADMPGPQDPNAKETISVVRGDGTGEKVLSTDGRTPNWTPDGRVVFASKRSGSEQVWIMDADGGNARQIGALDAKMDPIMPQLGKNGVVVFMGWNANEDPRGDSNGGIWAMKDDGSDLREIAVGMQPSLAISGTWVAYTFQTAGAWTSTAATSAR